MSTPIPSAPPASDENEFEWLFDYIVTFLKSPPWTVPMNSFIDENCIIFDNEEENKFVYTECHNAFRTLIDSLLSTNLSIIGVTEEQFVAACERGQQSSHEVNKLVFGQILAVDDFLTFKKLMCKRNRELEIEAIHLLHDYQPTNKSEAELQFELALALSQQESEGVNRKKGEKSDSETEAALAASIAEQERLRREAAREQAELEHAIAMSLALEKERVRLTEMTIEANKAAEAEAAAASTPTPAPTTPAPTPAPKPTPAQVAAVAPSSAPAPSTPTPSTPTPAPSTPTPNPPPARATTTSSTLPALAPSKLPSIDASVLPTLQATHQSNLQKATSILSSAPSQPIAASTSAGGATAGALNEAELKRRQEFLRGQRELLLKKKNAEREQQLKAFEKEKTQAAAAGDARAKPTVFPPSVSSSSSSGTSSSSMSADELKRSAMREALAARLKADMILVERKKAADSASVSAKNKDELSANLARVEELKKEQEQAKIKTAALMAEREKERKIQQQQLDAMQGVNAAEHNYKL